VAKEWILNSAMNRFQLNFKRNVGPVSEKIRKCAPKILEDWEEYYFKKGLCRKGLIRNLQINLEEKYFTYFQ